MRREGGLSWRYLDGVCLVYVALHSLYLVSFENEVSELTDDAVKDWENVGEYEVVLCRLRI